MKNQGDTDMMMRFMGKKEQPEEKPAKGQGFMSKLFKNNK
jgi:hypothetical protein